VMKNRIVPTFADVLDFLKITLTRKQKVMTDDEKIAKKIQMSSGLLNWNTGTGVTSLVHISNVIAVNEMHIMTKLFVNQLLQCRNVDSPIIFPISFSCVSRSMLTF